MHENVWIVVPVGAREKYLKDLLDSLEKYKGQIVFVNNNPGYARHDGVHHVEDFDNINIYRWWNRGIHEAKEMGAKYVVVLNDDLKFDSNYVSSLVQFLIDGNYAIVDTENSGNGGGAAWAMDLKYNLWLNQAFRWWYGDTEIFDRAKKLGKFARYSYKNFSHIEPNGLMSHSPELLELVKNDEKLYREITHETNVTI